MTAEGRRRFSSSLPEELIEQIVARVPCIKFIMRCTSVCKLWYALIKSAHFVNFHLSLIPNNDNIAKFLLCEYNEGEHPHTAIHDGIEAFHKSCYFYRHGYDSNEAAPYFAIHTDNEEFQECFRMESSPPHNLLKLHACNGLICFNTSDDPDCLYLWNPFIGKLKKLPRPFPNLKVDTNHDTVFKLWFDGKANDFKILKIDYTTTTCSVEVYSLSTNSWKLITDDAPVTISFLNNNRVALVNGICFWPARRDGKWTLVSLDLENGMIRERLTTSLAGKLYLTPTGDNGSLVIFGHGHQNYCPDVKLAGQICVFEVYDHSLNKLYTIDKVDYKIDRFHQPLGFRNNGEVLFQNMCSGFIVSYSVETKNFKEFVPTGSRRLLRAIPFVMTLALHNDASAFKFQRM